MSKPTVTGEQPAPRVRPTTPSEAWAALRDGNARFVSGELAHPHQDTLRRAELASGQAPFAVFFGCGDSRVAAELIFDQGLGDLFVVRTAGHVLDPSVLGSIEFGVAILDCPLIVVLGHDSCGAIKATLEAVQTGDTPGGFLRDIVERVTPSVLAAARYDDGSITAADVAPDLVEREHVRATARLLAERSTTIAERIADGRLAIVGAEYVLTDGHAKVVSVVGDVEGATVGA